MNPLKSYLSRMSEIRRSAAAVKETSYYGTLETLFNEAGKALKPKVRCIINLQNKGAGIPDGGLFTPDQFQRRSDDLIEGQLPARGAVEVKSTSEEIDLISDSTQVAKYLGKYRQVLVTNYRDFVLVVLDENNQPKKLERYSIAENEAAFWQKADHFNSTTEAENERLVEFLRRVMLHAAPIAKPEDVAWFLASYARDAKARIDEADLHALDTIRKALEESLGITFSGEKGEHFFRSTLVQTLFYGIFSAWVLWHKRHTTGGRASGLPVQKSSPPYEGGVATGGRASGLPAAESSDSLNANEVPTHTTRASETLALQSFNWRTAVWELRVPMISVLFGQVATPANVKNLNLEEVLDWTGNVLNRVVREEFFARFAEEHAVQYFYEPFLQAFDPELRKELGVWYTPEEIVRYMVERVDRVLREELNLPDGLADESVYVLDPACGTGAYLVEVLRRINRTLEEKGEDSVRGQKLKKALMSRVFGFEILPAPFVVSHLQIGLLLEELGVGFSEDKNERAGVYLTNSLTGWDEHPKSKLPFPEFEEERDRADEVKQTKPIIVILGNPPYNGYAGVAVEEERELSNAYRTTKKAPAPQGQGLNDLYVRFFRMAERRIAEISKKGVICYISNYSWLEGLSHPGMRERYLEVFDKIWIDNLHGDRIISEVAPDGKASNTIFAVRGSSVGIKVGTAIALLAVNDSNEHQLYYRDFDESNPETRRKSLLTSLEEINGYIQLEPNVKLGYPFKPNQVSENYFDWPLLPELFPVSFPGVKTSRDEALVDIERGRLLDRIKLYFNPNISDEEVLHRTPKLITDASRFDGRKTRKYLVKRGFKLEWVIRYAYRPFDNRWLYWEGETKLLDEKRSDYFPHVFDGNYFLFTTGRTRKTSVEPAITVKRLNDLNFMDSGARGFPLYLRNSESLNYDGNKFVPNTSKAAEDYLQKISAEASDLFFHSLAVLHSSNYRTEHLSSIRQNFPRIPLPANKDDLIVSAELGKRIAALLDTEQSVTGVTTGSILNELRSLGVASHLAGTMFQDDDLRITAGWGYAGRNGIVMPSEGKLDEREYSEKELELISEEAQGALGGRTLDIYLNNLAYWRNIPEGVWNYYIGGYQVMKKWLSYREFSLLGRGLTIDEVGEVTNMARRIAALLLMGPELDENYKKVKAETYQTSRYREW